MDEQDKKDLKAIKEFVKWAVADQKRALKSTTSDLERAVLKSTIADFNTYLEIYEEDLKK